MKICGRVYNQDSVGQLIPGHVQEPSFCYFKKEAEIVNRKTFTHNNKINFTAWKQPWTEINMNSVRTPIHY